MERDIDVHLTAAGAGPSRSRAYPVAKRVVDSSVSLLLILLTSPFWIAAAIAIKLDSPGPVLFRQQRIGQCGKQFVMYKFRSMISNADPAVHREVFRQFAGGQTLENDAHGPRFKKTTDSRTTRVGRVLRAANLDELPQLINVLTGDMSLVGPRPAIPYELEWYKQWYYGRFQVPSGMTGLWQLKARHRVDLEGMVRIDLDYIKRRSLWLDLRLLVLTIPGMFIEPRENGLGRGIKP